MAAGPAAASVAAAVADDALIVFTPSGLRGRFAKGTPVLEAARSLGVDLDSVCGGRGICGRCQVTIGEGAYAKLGITSSTAHLSEPAENEIRFAAKRGLAQGRRLSCSSRIEGDLVIDVPPASQVHKQVVRKRAEVRAVTVDPVVRLHYVEVEKPDLAHPSGDLRRLKAALAEQWGLGWLEADHHVARHLQALLRQGDWTLTVAVRNGEQIIAAWPGFHGRAFGLAIDIGSTTIAVHLTDLASGEVVAAGGAMNPQIRFGEDLMSRLSHIMLNPGGDIELTEAVRGALDELAGEVAAEAGVDRSDILEAAVVGNPVMHHLVLGIDPIELAAAPFALATDEAVTVKAAEIGLDLNPGARVYALPCIAGHVGADAAAVVLSEAPHRSEALQLIVDVGTNAEIVLGNQDRLLAASSPTGPAFEGAQISSGQRAAPGAIERVRIDPKTLEPRFKVIGCDAWSDEAGFEASISGICGSGIIEVIAELFLTGVITADGRIDGEMSALSDRVVEDGRTFAYVLAQGRTEIRITQNDVRAIQLAKAALYAGARLLMDRLGVTRVDRVVLAGAFGSQIDLKHAMILGLIPDCDLAQVSAAGNAAGTGARIALVNRAAREEIESLVRRIEKVETAVEAKFQDHFVDAMGLPHTTDPYPELAKAVTLPERKAEAPTEPQNGGRRRRRRG